MASAIRQKTDELFKKASLEKLLANKSKTSYFTDPTFEKSRTQVNRGFAPEGGHWLHDAAAKSVSNSLALRGSATTQSFDGSWFSRGRFRPVLHSSESATFANPNPGVFKSRKPVTDWFRTFSTNGRPTRPGQVFKPKAGSTPCTGLSSAAATTSTSEIGPIGIAHVEYSFSQRTASNRGGPFPYCVGGCPLFLPEVPKTKSLMALHSKIAEKNGSSLEEAARWFADYLKTDVAAPAGGGKVPRWQTKTFPAHVDHLFSSAKTLSNPVSFFMMDLGLNGRSPVDPTVPGWEILSGITFWQKYQELSVSWHFKHSPGQRVVDVRNSGYEELIPCFASYRSGPNLAPSQHGVMQKVSPISVTTTALLSFLQDEYSNPKSTVITSSSGSGSTCGLIWGLTSIGNCVFSFRIDPDCRPLFFCLSGPSIPMLTAIGPIAPSGVCSLSTDSKPKKERNVHRMTGSWFSRRKLPDSKPPMA